jgi:hypothetical protein
MKTRSILDDLTPAPRERASATVRLRWAPLVLTVAPSTPAACDGSATDDGIETVSFAYSGLGNCPAFTDAEACVCEHSNFGGRCKILSMAGGGTFPTPDSFSPLPNDEVSSIAVGSGVAVRAYDNDHFGFVDVCGWPPWGCTKAILHYVGTGNPGQLMSLPTLPNFNDAMSSVRIFGRLDESCSGPATFGTVRVYTNDFDGSRADCVVLRPGTFPNADSIGMHNDWMSSARVSSNRWLRVWKDDGPSGPSVDILTDTAVLGGGLNDNVSAAEVFAR